MGYLTFNDDETTMIEDWEVLTDLMERTEISDEYQEAWQNFDEVGTLAEVHSDLVREGSQERQVFEEYLTDNQYYYNPATKHVYNVQFGGPSVVLLSKSDWREVLRNLLERDPGTYINPVCIMEDVVKNSSLSKSSSFISTYNIMKGRK